MSCSCPISQIAIEKDTEIKELPNMGDITDESGASIMQLPSTPFLSKNQSCPPIISDDIIQGFFLNNDQQYLPESRATNRDYTLNFGINDEFEKEQKMKLILLIAGFLNIPYIKSTSIIPQEIIDITYQYYLQTKKGSDNIFYPEFGLMTEEMEIDEEIEYITSPSPDAIPLNNNKQSMTNTELLNTTSPRDISTNNKNHMLLQNVSIMIKNIENTSSEILKVFAPYPASAALAQNNMYHNNNGIMPGFGGFIPHQNQNQNIHFVVNQNMNQNQFQNQNMEQWNGDMPDFNRMSVEEIIRENYTIQELKQFKLIGRFLCDFKGSIFFQNLIQEGNNSKLVSNVIFNYIVENFNNILLLCNHRYAHFVIKLVFENINLSQAQILVTNLINTHSVLLLLQNSYGRHVFDTIIESQKQTNNDLFQLYLILFIDALKNESQQNQTMTPQQIFSEILFTRKGNDTLQKVVELRLPFERIKFLAEIIESNFIRFSIHKIACHFVQKFINIYGDKLNINILFKNRNNKNTDYLQICNEVHGNYTIQEMLKQNKWYSSTNSFRNFRSRFINDLFINCGKNRLLSICLNKAGSCVIETCLKVANKKQIKSFVQFIKTDHALILDKILTHKFGNYVIKTLINKLYDGGIKYNEYLRMTINTIHLKICDLYKMSFFYYHDYNTYYDCNGNRYVQQSPYCYAKSLIQQCSNIKQEIDIQYNQSSHQ